MGHHNEFLSTHANVKSFPSFRLVNVKTGEVKDLDVPRNDPVKLANAVLKENASLKEKYKSVTIDEALIKTLSPDLYKPKDDDNNNDDGGDNGNGGDGNKSSYLAQFTGYMGETWATTYGKLGIFAAVAVPVAAAVWYFWPSTKPTNVETDDSEEDPTGGQH